MISVQTFRKAAERIIGDESYGEDYVAALDREAPGWRDLPAEVIQSEMAAILAGLRTEADRTLDTYNATKERRS